MKRLVILAPNWLGDAVMAQPAIADVRRAMPDATIVLAARGPIASLYGMTPDVDDTIAVESLGRHGFDAALLLPNSFQSALAVFRAGIPERWGYRTDWRGPLLTRSVHRTSGLHQVESYQRLVRELGVPSGPAMPRVAVTDQVRGGGADELRRAGWDGREPLVALAPGAAWGSSKRWPAASFAELASTLGADGFRPVLVGSAADASVGREILRASRPRGAVLNVMGNDIRGMVGVLANCRALVSNDSGAMHLGAAIGLPVTVPFGPTDERLTRPLGDHHSVLTCPVWCRPCMLPECPLDHGCMRGIPVAAVAEAARRAL
jgi:heptosyltransferase-2